MKKALVVAGNGPSLREIDYTRLPKAYDVFRCNLFWFEDKYYLGRDVAMAFGNPDAFFEQYYTLKNLIESKDYNIAQIACANFEVESVEPHNFKETCRQFFCDALLGSTILFQNTHIESFIKFNELYQNQRINTGTYLCLLGAVMGYEEIYIAGIDLYTGGAVYGFDIHDKANLLQIKPAYATIAANTKHNPQINLKALELLAHICDTRLYTIAPSSPLCEHIPLAPVQNPQPNFTPEQKPQNCIKDILLPNKRAYRNYHKRQRRSALEKNFYYTLIRDLLRLPSNIKNHFKDKKHQKTLLR